MAARSIGNSLFFLLMAGALVAVVLGVSLPSWPKILGVLNNAAHAPVFGVFALIALRLTREWRQSATARARDYVLAFLVATGVGGLVEVAQAFLERDASLADLGTDALGAGCALGLAAAFDPRLREARTRATGRAAVATVGLLAGLWALWPVGQAAIAYADRAMAFPVVARFSSVRDLYFIRSGTARLWLQPLPARWARAGDDQSVRVDFHHHLVAGPEPRRTRTRLARLLGADPRLDQPARDSFTVDGARSRRNARSTLRRPVQSRLRGAAVESHSPANSHR